MFLAGSTVVSKNNDPANSSQIVHSFSKIQQNIQKSFLTQIVDIESTSNLEFAEYDFQMSDAVDGIMIITSIFGFIYAFGLLFKKRLKVLINATISDFYVIKKFILICSIRI